MAAPAAAPERTAGRSAGLAVLAAGTGGALVSLQQRINGELGIAVGDALVAALVSFGVGLAAVAVVVLARPSSRRALPVVRRMPRWQLLGGLGGACLVAAGAAAAPAVGVALFTVALVAGQTGGALLVDRAGLGPGGQVPVTAPRLAGAALCLAAVAVSTAGRGVGDADPVLLVAVVLAGCLVAAQQAVNGQVRKATGDAGIATLVNFLVGTVAVLAAVAVVATLSGLDVGGWPGPDRWYLYTGGPIGALSVPVAAIVVQQLGVLRLGLAVLVGQLTGAVLLDLALPAPGGRLALPTVAAAGLTLAAVALSGRGAR